MSCLRRPHSGRPVVLTAASAVAALMLAAPVLAQGEEATPGTTNTLNLTLDTGDPAPPPPPVSKPAPSPKQRTAIRGGARLPGLPLPSRNGVRSLRQQAAQAPKILAQLGSVIAPQIEVHAGIEPGSRLLSKVPNGTYVAIIAEAGEYWGVLMANNTVGWTAKAGLELLDYKTQITAPGSGESDPAAETSTEAYAGDMDPRIQGVLREAFTYLGVPYVWGGNSRGGLDCSAFVRACFRTAGIDLPRHSGDQITQGRAVNDLKSGDRLYFDCSARMPGIDHTGIYLGKGLFIHASGSHGRVVVESLNKPIYLKGLVAIRRDFE